VAEAAGGGETSAGRAAATACTAELAWVGPDGPRAAAVVPLVLDDRPAVAMPYAYAESLRPAGASVRVSLAMTDARMTGRDWQPCVVTGRPSLHDDLDGELFAQHLLGQEVRKHPPSRAYVDSLILRRENWWYLARLVLTIDVDRLVEVPARTMPGEDAVLVTVAPDGGPEVVPVRVPDWSARPLRLVDTAGTPVAAEGPAALLGHDFSVPDVERWVQCLLTGTARDGGLEVGGAAGSDPPSGRGDGAPAAPVLPPPLRLRQRMGRQRELERRCRRGIAAAERATRR
jgi:hypothetical protein